MIARNIIDFNMTALQAITAPRLHDQIYPPITTLESDNELMSFKGCVFPSSLHFPHPSPPNPDRVPRFESLA
jgi:hypothetical protein